MTTNYMFVAIQNKTNLGYPLSLQESGFSVGRKPVRWRSDVTPPTPRIIQDRARVRCFPVRVEIKKLIVPITNFIHINLQLDKYCIIKI